MSQSPHLVRRREIEKIEKLVCVVAMIEIAWYYEYIFINSPSDLTVRLRVLFEYGLRSDLRRT